MGNLSNIVRCVEYYSDTKSNCVRKFSSSDEKDILLIESCIDHFYLYNEEK